jgi:hypothetical protein
VKRERTKRVLVLELGAHAGLDEESVRLERESEVERGSGSAQQGRYGARSGWESDARRAARREEERCGLARMCSAGGVAVSRGGVMVVVEEQGARDWPHSERGVRSLV